MVGISALLLVRPDVRAQVFRSEELADQTSEGDVHFTVAAASASSESTAGVTLGQVDARSAAAGSSRDTGAQGLSDPSVASLFEGFSLRPGPIRYGGSLSTDVRVTSAEKQPGTLQMVDHANIAGATYLWQPWFAQVRVGAGFVTSRSRTQADPAQINASTSSTSKSLTGEFSASVFPLSRFPFEVFANRSDSRASGEAIGSDFTTSRLGFRQTYMPLDGMSRYTARYERNTLSSLAIGEDTVSLLEATASRRMGPHNVEVTGNHSTNTGGVGGASSRFDRLNARHSWMPATNMQVETLGSASRTLLRSGTAGIGEVASQFVQLTSFGSWRPEEGEWLFDEERPVYLTASGRLFSLATQSAGQGADAFSMSGSMGATYNWNRETRLTGTFNATQSRAGGTDGLFTSQVASAVYTPPSVRLGAVSYNWSLSASGGNFTSTIEGNRQSLGTQASHNVQRSFELGERSRLNLSANQALGIAYDTKAAAAMSISHGLGATWLTSADSGSQTYVSLTAADARNVGGVRTSFQIANLQASRQNSLTRMSYWAGHLTLQWTRQTSPTLSSNPESAPGAAPIELRSGGTNLTATGSLSYFNQRVLDIPRLRFTATATLASQQFDTRLAGNPEARRENVSRLVEGRFDYTIGRLDLRFSARSAVIDGRTDHLIFFRMSRRFGLF